MGGEKKKLFFHLENIVILLVRTKKPKTMKTTSIFILILCLSVPVFAQQNRAVLSTSMQNRAVLSPKYNGQGELPLKLSNAIVANKNVTDDIMGGSRYDNQSNGSMASRLYLWPDNSLSAAWIRGMDDAGGYADRGTGYNYNDGTSWGALPSARTETTRTGWPSLNPWMGNGEITFAHNSTATLIMNTRPAKGTGAWTQSLSPTGPTGVTTLLWPSVITSGPNHQYVHILVIGQPSYTGMSDALLYFRSLDGGATWDKPGVILPGMTIADGLGYAGDDYTWAAPRGDTIAFVVAGNWEDGYIMKSFDNGNTWTKTVFFNNPYKLTPNTTVVPTFYCLDGSNAIQIDNNGLAHVAVGRMRANGDGSGATGRFYFPGTDGLIYWNETMPVMDTTFISNLDTLDAHGRLIGYVASNVAGDSIVGLPLYGVCMTAFPRIVIDPSNNVYFLWSAITVGNPDPTPLNYRHLWCRMRTAQGSLHSMVDLNADFFYIFQEFVYPATAPKLRNNNIEMIFQTSGQPGSNIQDTSIPIHDVDISFRELPVSLFVGINNPGTGTVKNQVSRNYPNPVNRSTQVNVNLGKPSKVNIEVTNMLGQKVMGLDKGVMTSGAHSISLDCSGLGRGFYCLTVNINGESFTNRMIKE